MAPWQGKAAGKGGGPTLFRTHHLASIKEVSLLSVLFGQ